MANDLEGHKAEVRSRIWATLGKVAVPDSRFHLDFGSFIADFEGGAAAVARLIAHHAYREANMVFITPDNCLDRLRLQALQDGKTVLVTTYAIKRGFWLLEPSAIPEELHLYASTLDGMERVGRPVDLHEICMMPAIDLMVTGTGAINLQGVRFGKGHGFFDAEWGMLYQLTKVGPLTPIFAVVHDCQVVDEKLYPDIFDTVADAIFTPTREIGVAAPQKPTCGIVWDRLNPDMFATIPPLQQLRMMFP
jgi:5-formyltetrahydrofolate cyclo-ligase